MTAAFPSGLSLDRASALTRQVTRLSVGVAVALTAIKAVAWVVSGSVAMLASLADSGLDVLAAMVTFFAVRYAASPPDREHRYGHGKAEAFASLTQAGLVFASGALVAEQAIPRLIAPHRLAYEGWGLAVMALSILLTAGLVSAQSWTLRRAKSVAVEGDRMHYLADLASNLIAFAGIGASALLRRGEPDALAGLVVAGWLVWGAVGVFRRAAFELMDHELSDEARRRIVELMTEDPRVGDVHQLRTRASGPYVHIQMHADLDPSLSLVEAHRVMVAAERRVLNAFPAADIIIHPDPRGAAEPHGGAFPEVHEPVRERAAR
ncbi:MAG TPA: cation diffusion facilitator family transporter [Caulobacteraceae bacterium]|nr:cation diffusion facilitator family transporter [Caulobacteraceae bacterium]